MQSGFAELVYPPGLLSVRCDDVVLELSQIFNAVCFWVLVTQKLLKV
jgi:hypothetical protein